MAHGGQRALTFRLGDAGFLLGIQNLVEVLGSVSGLLDFSKNDLQNSIVAALDFRRTLIPAVDPARGFGIDSRVKLQDKIALVLGGSEGNWAILVDQVEELTGDEKLLPCAFPDLLRPAVEGVYTQVRLINDEPYVVFEPENFYGAETPAV